MRTRSIEQQKRIASQRARIHLAIKKEKNGRDLETAKALIEAALDIARDSSSAEAYRAGRAALKAAFGHKYPIRRDDVLKTLLASATFFSSEA